jgi:hypothetical protein
MGCELMAVPVEALQAPLVIGPQSRNESVPAKLEIPVTLSTAESRTVTEPVPIEISARLSPSESGVRFVVPSACFGVVVNDEPHASTAGNGAAFGVGAFVELGITSARDLFRRRGIAGADGLSKCRRHGLRTLDNGGPG